MNKIRSLSDGAAVSLSMLCMLHCLMLPLILALLPASIALTVGDEAFHLFMVFMVIPLSLFALFFGCKDHQRYRVLVMGSIGLALLLAAILLPHELLGESGEKALTVLGSIIIASGHLLNYKLCKKSQADCECSAS